MTFTWCITQEQAGSQCANSLSWFPVSFVGRQSVMTTPQIATAQEQDPVLSSICGHLQTNPQAALLHPGGRNFHYAAIVAVDSF